MNQRVSSRGVAMLLTLVAVMIVSTTGLMMLRTSAAFSLESKRTLFDARARIVAQDLRQPLLDWVRERATAIPDEEPFGGSLTRGDWTVNIRAIDLAGCLHARWLGAAPIAATLPVPLNSAHLPDRYATLDWDRCTLEQRPTVEELLARENGDQTSISVHEWLTVAGKGDLNITTAPLPLLEAVLSSVDADARDVRSILEARRDSTAIDTNAAGRVIAAARRQSDQAPGSVVPLTQSSGPWGFVVEVSQGRQSARYWLSVEQLRIERKSRRHTDWSIAEFRRVP